MGDGCQNDKGKSQWLRETKKYMARGRFEKG
jgi:hypothetical protein